SGAVLGANDGIASIASLAVGLAAPHTSRGGVLIASIAGLVAGAMSMAAGEYVSVSSQADTEKSRPQARARRTGDRRRGRAPGAREDLRAKRARSCPGA